MAASGLLRELHCSVCLALFTDPVSLPCDHSFCRRCIESSFLALGPTCPVCRGTCGPRDLRPSRVLRNLVEQVRTELSMGVCPEHQEKLKLFCETDRRLICVICRDALGHRGHRFTPVQEAAASSKVEVEKALEFLSKDNNDLADLTHRQTDEIEKTKRKSSRLLEQMSAQFKELHQFLRRREAELEKEVQNEMMKVMAPMEKHLGEMNLLLSARWEEETMLRLALPIRQPDRFQQWWIDNGSSAVEKLKTGTVEGNSEAACTLYKSAVSGLQVIPYTPNSLSLGPYETHLQFFMAKEILRVIKPVPERVTIKDLDDPCLKVALDASSVRHVDTRCGFMGKNSPEFSMSHAWSIESFRSGCHYWEVEVGSKTHWSLGLDAQSTSSKHAIYRLNGRFGKLRIKTHKEVPLDLKRNPRKIGTYLDCERKCVSFYNADDMSLIHTHKYETDQSLFVYFNPGFYLQGKNAEPLTVTWY